MSIPEVPKLIDIISFNSYAVNICYIEIYLECSITGHLGFQDKPLFLVLHPYLISLLKQLSQTQQITIHCWTVHHILNYSIALILSLDHHISYTFTAD